MSTVIEGAVAIEIAKKKCLELLIKLDEICSKNDIRYWIDGGTLLGAIRHQGFIPWDDDIDICIPAPDYYKLIDVLSQFCKEDNSYILFHGDSNFHFCFDFFGDITYLIDGVYPVRIDLFPVKMIENRAEAIRIDKSWTNIAAIYFRGYAKNEADIIPEHAHLIPKGKNLIQEKETFFALYKDYLLSNYSDENFSDKLLNYSLNDMLVAKDRGYYEYDTIFPLKRIDFEGHPLSCPNQTDKYLSSLYTNYMELPPLESRISHLNILHENELTKKQIKTFLNAFYVMGFKNFAIGKRDQKVYRMWLKASSFMFLFAKFTLQFQFKLTRNLIRYAKTKVN